MQLRRFLTWGVLGLMTTAGGCSAGSRQVLVIGHRGDADVCPENTLVSFQSAAEGGADLVELDSHATKDGVLVTIHDGTLDRTTNSVKVWRKEKQNVADHTYADISKLDAGSWKSPKFAGQRVPTLAQAVEAINPHSMTLLERKAGTAMAHAKYLRSSGQIERTVVQSFDWDFVAAVHTLLPEVRLAALGGHEVTPEIVSDLCMTGAKTAVWRHKDLDPNGMKLFRKAGLQVWVYTANEPEEWDRLYNLGVDGIITDKPKQCKAWLKERQGG